MEESLPVVLRKEQVHCFQAQGFLRIGRITTDEEIMWLRTLYDEIIKQKVGYAPDELTNATNGHGPLSLISFLSPEGMAPAKNVVNQGQRL